MALTKEDLQAISDLMDAKLEPIHEQLDALQEDSTITRGATNSILDWISKIEPVNGVPFSRAE